VELFAPCAGQRTKNAGRGAPNSVNHTTSHHTTRSVTHALTSANISSLELLGGNTCSSRITHDDDDDDDERGVNDPN
jgi:hypothetical protein